MAFKYELILNQELSSAEEVGYSTIQKCTSELVCLDSLPHYSKHVNPSVHLKITCAKS